MTYKRLTYLLLSFISALLCLIMLSCMGCATLSCPRLDTGQTRILNTILVVDHVIDSGGPNLNDHSGCGNQFVTKCGEQWFAQTGIKLNIVKTIKINKWQESDLQRITIELEKVLAENKIKPTDYDISIGLGASTIGALDSALMLFIPRLVWFGGIDNKYRRYIRLKGTNCWRLQHELAHAFVFDELHGGGLLSSIDFFSTNSSCLREVDFKELQRNKFRNFNEPVIYK